MATERDVETLISVISQLGQRIARLEAREINPVGTILMNANPVIPANHLACDGGSYSKTDYETLYAVLGTRYGGNASLFMVPDLRGRTVVGSGNRWGPGETGGEETHILTKNEMPNHNHGGNSGATQPFITYPGTGGGAFGRLYGDYAGGGGFNLAYLAPTGGATAGSNAAYADSHTHTITSEGGSVAHNNMPPYIVIPFIIVAR